MRTIARTRACTPPRSPRWLLACALLLLVGVVACEKSVALPDGFSPEGPIDCRFELAADEVPLFQAVRATLWLYVDAETAPEWPETSIPEGFLGGVERDEVRPYEDGYLLRRTLSLRPTKLGSLTFPSLPLEVAGHKTSTPDQSISVVSVLRSGDDQAVLEDPAAPFEPEFRWGLWGAIGGGVLLLALAILLWVRARRRRPQRLPVEVPVLPHVKAMRALARLRQAERSTEEQIERFYVDVSQVLREYLEERFGLHAPQRSTEEFLVELERGGDLNLAHRQSLRQFLQQCDLVKFAKVIPGTDVHEQTLRIAESVVEETRSDGPADTGVGTGAGTDRAAANSSAEEGAR